MQRTCAEMDRILGTDPRFGSADAIAARNTARFRVGLRLLGRHHVSHAAEFRRIERLPDDALRRVLYDPVLRNAFERDLNLLTVRPEDPSTLALMLRQSPVSEAGFGPCEALMDVHHEPWPDLGPAWTWTSTLPEEAHPLLTALGRRRDDVFAEMGADRRVVPDAETLAALTRGARLLAELLPHSGAGALRHVALVGFAEGEEEDGSVHSFACGDRLPSALFLSPQALRDPWKVAELLFHEALHLKMFDIMRTGALVGDIGRMTGTPPWRVVDWNLRRVYSSLHVYGHMVLFFAAAASAPADLRRRYGEPLAPDSVGMVTPGSAASADGTYTTSEDRTRYLAHQALEAHADALTPDGRALVTWMLEALEPLLPGVVAPESTPPAPSLPSTAPSAPAGAATPAEPAPAAGYRQCGPVTVLPLPEQGMLLAAAPATNRMHWLNSRAWLVYALCDGRDAARLERDYHRAAPDDPAGPAVALAALQQAGLIAPVPGGGAGERHAKEDAKEAVPEGALR
ncbi:aKG-HExxH-type peptide beta-hydroxylase [Streptomyces sp. NRRL F-2747]|uniref:aKG-HExxH-type peptide beta-hydroxylase n=1 Tax=Streptomyces sp. NRRL F-2747 TaxID=1463843 RepID=UPI0004CA203B|nr:HEXXH motif-containing putative peptide modification protein [Streptomyces sp. NRRL F-2747]